MYISIYTINVILSIPLLGREKNGVFYFKTHGHFYYFFNVRLYSVLAFVLLQHLLSKSFIMWLHAINFDSNAATNDAIIP